ncbi:cytochrome C [Lacihabitans sp. LS3-19]|uniref:c-type cytochrome n=1 Tax=Lacihabitans sp. LS3-19 TaxID=2487335 RepID=UPI0020CC238A|nr:c-type cytochrome [Lacihabitans sp. LS3-19]MCP9768580.1 cytochrome C [Lacihabitans sp. LS3-19]
MEGKNLFTTFKVLKNVLYILAIMPFLLVTGLALNSSNVLDFSSDEKEVEKKEKSEVFVPQKPMWQAMSMDALVHEKDPELIKYGKELIANTSVYLGPKGKVAHTSNGMNCQNCHLDAGTRPWGNNYGAVLANYPKMRKRSGTVEGIEKRINDCFERSLNGRGLDSNSREMRAMVSYIKFIGQFVPKDSIPNGTGIWKLKYLDRAADPARGQIAYEEKCVVCHGKNGEGIMNAEGNAYTYPPLWGPHSYNHGAGLFRLSRFAGYIKANMPFGATYDKPQLTDEESWDIAAYVDSRPRPGKDLSKDWPKVAGKPVDHPFGPYADAFSEQQHKFGPFKPIDDFYKKNK